MSPDRHTFHPRGLSTAATVIALIVALALVVVGFAAGRWSVGNKTVATTDVSTTPKIPGTTTNLPPAVTAAPAETSPAPIAFQPAELDFGSVPPDVEMRRVVQVQNVGDTPLTVRAMRPDCKCTTVQDLTGTTLRPGESVPFTVVMEARDSVGTKASEVRFLFEGYSEVSTFHVSSNVSRAVASEPAYFEVVRGDTSGLITVFSIDDRPFRVLAIDGGPVAYADDYNPDLDPPRTEYVLEWSIAQYDPETCLDPNGRRMPGWWVIETDHPEAPVVDVHVRHVPCTVPEARNGRPWVLSALNRVVGGIPAGGSTEFSVYLKWLPFGAEPSDTIKSVVSESDDFDATLVDVERDGDKITCRVQITPKSSHRGLVYGDVRLFSYHPGHSQAITIVGRVIDDAGEKQASHR